MEHVRVEGLFEIGNRLNGVEAAGKTVEGVEARALDHILFKDTSQHFCYEINSNFRGKRTISQSCAYMGMKKKFENVITAIFSK